MTINYAAAETVEDFKHNLAVVEEKIAAACKAAGRARDEVRLLPVSKTVPEERLFNAVAAGATRLGENKVQEAKRKWQNMREATNDQLEWAVIGHLQRNKAKDVAEFAAEFQALDSVRLAEALQRRLEMVERELEVYVQVNTSAEESKFGLDPQDVDAFLDTLPNYPNLKVQGFMTLAIFSDDSDRVRTCFELLRQIRDRALLTHGDLIGSGLLSMGMSGDYELAIAEGANCVRVGQAIFGSRKYPDSYYWPGAAGTN
ncbi:YggS family pyridoxal phosphate-dependent enzyme [Canibacter zhoujuaniae]|uniref:YggS family pyridoxal phosphate-dependent enzyme n=1 Tax=Canibacter zhoujuaniae TaxID=2708343 RepID=UPI001421C56D|nr:YggS family pyridoxal phosphate-dependent enzyme [Canibacter zhoujuaniae]